MQVKFALTEECP